MTVPSPSALGRTSFRLPALTESRFARFACIILLYFMQGLPVGLATIAIPAWLAANGSSTEQIGVFVGTALLPWSLKLFNGIIMDRFTFRPMGRRRVWILTAQSMMVLTLLAFGAVSPTADQIGLLAGFMFALNVCAVFNDVATDGMTVDLVPDAERTTVNGVMFASQSVGVAATGFVAGQLLAIGQMSLLAILMACAAAAASTFLSVFRERPGERLLPWSKGQASAECEARQHNAWWPIAKGIVRGVMTPLTLLYLVGVGTTQATAAFADSIAPSMAVKQLGWASDEYSSFASLMSLIAAGCGAIIVPIAVKVVGLRNVVIAISLGLATVSLIGGLTYSGWQNDQIFTVLLGLQFTLALASTIVAVVWAMRICDPAVGASLFALFMAVPNFSRSAFNGLVGQVTENFGFSGAYYSVTVMTLVGLAFYLLGRIGDDKVAPPAE